MDDHGSSTHISSTVSTHISSTVASFYTQARLSRIKYQWVSASDDKWSSVNSFTPDPMSFASLSAVYNPLPRCRSYLSTTGSEPLTALPPSLFIDLLQVWRSPTSFPAYSIPRPPPPHISTHIQREHTPPQHRSNLHPQMCTNLGTLQNSTQLHSCASACMFIHTCA